MKNVPRLLRRFIGILMLSSVLLLLINFGAFALIIIKHSPNISVSPYNIAEETGKALRTFESEYILPEEISHKLEANNAWAFLIDKDTLQVVWETENVPDNTPDAYTLSDIPDLTIGYLDGYPTYMGKAENGIVVLGFPKDSFWKHTRPSWDYHFIANLPYTILKILIINTAIILMIYIIANVKFLKPVKPIINGIQDLSAGKPVHIHEKGLLSEISANINRTSEILQKQQIQLKRKEKARANWIAGVSHDIRTPLSMIMGYAGQLDNSKNLSETEHKKAAVIIRQSNRIKNLINDLNLASKLEYDMQPLVRTQENAISIVRQAVVDFMNMSVDTNYPIEWKTSSNLSACYINIDKNLLKRAIANLIQNSINHNENGCIIYASVDDDENGNCIICIEDNGVGASDELIAQLNNAPHYMVCDTNTTEQRHGLGLLIVKQIINVHNGKVLIDHSKYGGFKVILIIPK
ncbi:MAG: HAMP domain-containing histidine kinase [Lachnospiraceae bacterium]|nr:HAMP domain-containing histidine kinase [Lachnospiraceae bacterium]